jgi:uncharacterized membrane protein
MQRGFKRLTSVLSVAVLGCLVGLAADLVRLRVARHELQAFVDEAALAAKLELDGTSRGMVRAEIVAFSRTLDTPGRLRSGVRMIGCVAMQFGATPRGPFSSMPPTSASANSIRLQATARAKLYMLPRLLGVASQNLTAVAVAGPAQSDGSLSILQAGQDMSNTDLDVIAESDPANAWTEAK